MLEIYVDADACPVKGEILKVAERQKHSLLRPRIRGISNLRQAHHHCRCRPGIAQLHDSIDHLAESLSLLTLLADLCAFKLRHIVEVEDGVGRVSKILPVLPPLHRRR